MLKYVGEKKNYRKNRIVIMPFANITSFKIFGKIGPQKIVIHEISNKYIHRDKSATATGRDVFV